MASKNFIAPRLPVPPAQYDQQFMEQFTSFTPGKPQIRISEPSTPGDGIGSSELEMKFTIINHKCKGAAFSDP